MTDDTAGFAAELTPTGYAIRPRSPGPGLGLVSSGAGWARERQHGRCVLAVEQPKSLQRIGIRPPHGAVNSGARPEARTSLTLVASRSSACLGFP